MLARIWGHMRVAQVKKNGPASEEISLVHFTGGSPPDSALAPASSGAPNFVLCARFGAGTTENGDWESCVLEAVGPWDVIGRTVLLHRFGDTFGDGAVTNRVTMVQTAKKPSPNAWQVHLLDLHAALAHLRLN
jgi:hypothetical protein